jgi:hypothetical protein
LGRVLSHFASLRWVHRAAMLAECVSEGE